jgi:hypothetical protein
MTVYELAETPASENQRRTRVGRWKTLAMLAVCAAPVVASYLTYFVVKPTGPTTNYGALIQPTRAMPERDLGTLDGHTQPSRALRGQWLLVVVASSRCDDGCEKRLYAQRQLREMLGRERERLDKVWFVTDGEAPTPALLAAMRAPPPVTVLRWARDDLARWLQPAAGQALEDHLYLVDPMGQWMMRFPVDFEPAKIKRDLDRLLSASASWDRAGR